MAWQPLPVAHLVRLEIEEDLPLQRHIWRFERIGWAALSLFVGAGLVGLFGGGPLSRGEAADPSGTLAIRYERFIHNDTQTSLELRAGAAQPDGWRWVLLSADYANRVRIERVMPAPQRTVVTEATVRLGFDPGQLGERGVIVLALTPIQAGLLQGEISSGTGTSVAFTQLVYP